VSVNSRGIDKSLTAHIALTKQSSKHGNPTSDHPSVIDSKGHSPSRYRRVKADKVQATGFKGIARGRERRTPIDIQANGKKVRNAKWRWMKGSQVTPRLSSSRPEPLP
jgi:hypothetical protein